MSVDATADYKGAKRVKRLFAMVADQAVVLLDDVAGEKVTMMMQVGFTPKIQADKASATMTGKQGALWIGTFGPQTALTVEGPRDFGKSWIYRNLAEAGEVQWHTLKGEYPAAASRPAVTVLVPVGSTQPAPAVSVQHAADNITVQLPGNRRVRFARGADGWEVAR